MTKLHDLSNLGQSIWYDNIRRSLLEDGSLQALLNDGVMGVTSNPTIFEKAIAGSSDYDDAIQAMVAQTKILSAEEIYEALAVADIKNAADLLYPIYYRSQGVDGYISLEVSPTLAHDTQGTIADARRLWKQVDKPNVMIKVPATTAGIPAIATLIGEGINVNVTLIFSLESYEAVANAYITGLETRALQGADVRNVASVASFFVSRVDSAVDAELMKKGNTALLGTIAIANAKVAYARFQQLFSGERWATLAAKGARVQRPLWASTGSKNPAYSDTIYIDNLIGADTVNTLPPAALTAFLDHGHVQATIAQGLDEARSHLAALNAAGIDLAAITQKLQEEGVASFAKSFQSLMASVAEKHNKLQMQSMAMVMEPM